MSDDLTIRIDSKTADSDIDKLQKRLKTLVSKKYRVDINANTGHFSRKLTTLERTLKRLQTYQIASNASIRAEKELIKLEQQKQREIMKTNALLKQQSKAQSSGVQYQQKQNRGGFSNITRKGMSGSGGDYISQMPQNPMLGRFAQFGMMASGMAATIFLMQMIAAQIANLMETIISWEESVLNIIEKTDITSKNMDVLSDTIRSYARSMGTDQVATAGAFGAAIDYGITPSQGNVEQLFKLNSSNLIKDFEQAALVMELAGTEMGDRFANQAIKRWDAYAGTNQSSGSFGFEWGNLKSSAKEGLFHVWSKEDTQYGKQLTDTMHQISDWVKNNRQTVGSVFDGLVMGIKAVAEALKFAMPAMMVFTTAFLAINSWKILDWMLVGISEKMMVMAHGMAAATKSMAGFKAVVMGLGTTLTSLLPAVTAFVAIWGAWKVGKTIFEADKLNKSLKEAEKLTKDRAKELSQAERDSMSSRFKNNEMALRESLKKEQKILEDFQKAQSLSGGGFESEIDRATKIIDQLDKKIKGLKSGQSTVQAINDEIKHGIQVPEHVTGTWDEWYASLKLVHQELGYIPEDLKKINNAAANTKFKKDQGMLGEGQAGLIKQIQLFKNELVGSSEKNKEYQEGLGLASLKDPGGFSKLEEQIYLLKQLKKNLNPAELVEFDKVMANLSTQKATEDMKSFIRAIGTLNDTVNQLDMTDFEKTLFSIKKQFGNMDTSGMVSDQRKIWTKKLEDQLATWQGKDPSTANWIKDVKNYSNLSESEKTQMIDYKKGQEDLVALQFKLNVEKQKGLKFASAEQTLLEQQIKDLQAKMRHGIGLIKPEDYRLITKYNKELKDFTDALNDAQRGQLVGQVATTANGGAMSDIERDANIQLKQLKVAQSLASTDVKLKYSQEKLNEIQRKANIEIEENASKDQLQSQITALQESRSVYRQYYQIRGQMTKKHYDAERKIIDANYKVNEIKAGTYYAEMIRKEEEFQLKLQNRKNLTTSEDLALGLESAGKKIAASYQTVGEAVETVTVSAFEHANDAMMSWINGTESAKEAFKTMARSILSDIAQIIVKQQLLNLTLGEGYASGSSSVMGGIFGGIGKLFGFAAGGVAGGVSAYRNQVVNTPTFVPGGTKFHAYATGGALFGEAGPEAIMPLTRMPSGNLGVEAAASAPNIEINIENNGQPVDAQQKRPPRFDGEKYVIDVVLNHTKNNVGGFKTSMKGMLSS